jgi:hypothetical protein
MAVTSQNAAFLLQKLLEKALLSPSYFKTGNIINIKNNSGSLKYK